MLGVDKLSDSQKNDGNDIRVRGLLNSMYDQMIFWNANGMASKMSLQKYLGLTTEEFLNFNSDPEKWANCYLEKMWGSE